MHFPLATAVLAACVAAKFNVPSAACDEDNRKICYGKDGGVSQDLTLDDVQYVADHLRYLAQTGQQLFFNMPKSDTCGEWALPVPRSGSVLALAKHIAPRVNSTVLLEDLARAVDGGENAKEEQRAKALIGCGKNGGQVAVTPSGKDARYESDWYKASGAEPRGIIIKLVKAPSS
ncbi:hypothetical protein VHEMI01599 [[Torrubiella] hemipterigena]|uniref:Uncharacterized protein n=1 Tax=[Torrubiella] hemipterigena TaxID=1531966 RepID=A0A0A1T588_9HYPO|nr:hypothetical protein VHEMI01599 [[Torrubiella] hemipterigena]